MAYWFKIIYRYSYTAGVCIGALIELAQISHNTTYLTMAHNVTR